MTEKTQLSHNIAQQIWTEFGSQLKEADFAFVKTYKKGMPNLSDLPTKGIIGGPSAHNGWDIAHQTAWQSTREYLQSVFDKYDKGNTNLLRARSQILTLREGLADAVRKGQFAVSEIHDAKFKGWSGEKLLKNNRQVVQRIGAQAWPPVKPDTKHVPINSGTQQPLKSRKSKLLNAFNKLASNRGVQKLGVAGLVIGIGVTANEARAQFAAGDTRGGTKTIAGLAGGTLGGILTGAVAGAAIGGPIGFFVGVGVGIAGGYFGEKLTNKAFDRLWSPNQSDGTTKASSGGSQGSDQLNGGSSGAGNVQAQAIPEPRPEYIFSTNDPSQATSTRSSLEEHGLAWPNFDKPKQDGDPKQDSASDFNLEEYLKGVDLAKSFEDLLPNYDDLLRSLENLLTPEPVFEGWGVPVILDLTGKGINITPLSSSNTFFDMAGDGYQHRTAWAGVGDGVLVYDPDNTGKITQKNQVVFTEWDPTATSDMQALRDVFDTNGDGKLDAGDANFTKFKVLVTNADGTQTLRTLAELGITSINLTPDSTSVVLPDGSSIDGQTTYTRADGSTGTAATVTLRSDANGYAVTQTVTHNGDGSTAIDNKALNPDGSLANETISVTSADGASRTLSFDDNGDGVFDRVQTDVTVVNAGGSTGTLTNRTGAGVLLDQTVTSTSADGKSIAITRDFNGDGLADQTETRVTDAGGVFTNILTDLNPDGTVVDRTASVLSADGLTRSMSSDLDGNGSIDFTRVDATVVAADGSRTEALTERNNDGSLIDQTVTRTSADGRSKTVQDDINGDGVIDVTSSFVIAVAADGSSTSTQTDSAGNGALIHRIVTSISANGLAIVTQTDANGDGVFDETISDVTTVAADGSRTETVTATAANGALIGRTVTFKGADGVTRTIQTDSAGLGAWTSVETVVNQGASGVTDTLSSYATGGALTGRTVTATSADGLTVTRQADVNGDGVFDIQQRSVTVKNPNGSSTVTLTHLAGNGAVIDTTVTTTSADGLTITSQSNVDGIPTTTSDVTTVAADGSRTETVQVRSAGGALLGDIVTAVSADRKTRTITSDLNGDGHADQIETVVEQANGSVVDTVTNYAPNGAQTGQTATVASANGLSQTSTVNIDGKIDLTTSDVTVINIDGSRTETVTTRSPDNSLVSQTITTTSANGLSSTTTHNVDGKIDGKTTDVIALNVDGSSSETVTQFDAAGSKVGSTTTTTSANGLSRTTLVDENGDGVTDITETDVETLNADGSTTETVRAVYANGALRSSSVATTSANGLTVTIQADRTGRGAVDLVSTSTTRTNGDVVETVQNYNQDGSLIGQTVTTTSASGLAATTQTDLNGDGLFDRIQSDVVVINQDGSTTETITLTAGASVIETAVKTTSANGLTKTTARSIRGRSKISESFGSQPKKRIASGFTPGHGHYRIAA